MREGIATFGNVHGTSREQIESNMVEWRKTPKVPGSLQNVRPNLYVDSFIGLIDGLQYLHDKSIMHRDLKLSNIMYNYSGNWKICDFSHSRIHHTTHSPFSTVTWYTPPEQALKGDGIRVNYTYTVDVYSMGLIFYQMLNQSNFEYTSSFLISARNEFLRYCYRKIVDPSVPNHLAYFPGWKELVIKMIDKDPGRRLSVAQVKESLLIMKEQVRLYNVGRSIDEGPPELHPDVFWFDRKYDPNRNRE